MSNRSIAELTFRVTGIYAFVQSIAYTRNMLMVLSLYTWPNVGAPYTAISVNEINRIALVELFPFLFLGSLAWFLIRKAPKLAAGIFPDPEGETQSNSFLAIHAFAYSVVGIILIASSLPRLVTMVIERAWSGDLFMAPFNGIIYFLDPMLRTGIGVGLFFGSHGLARVWSRLRYSGVRRQMGLCIRCGYDLTGNTTGVCPECGTQQNPTH